MLLTLFDFPWEDRRKLTRWSDVATSEEAFKTPEGEAAREAELLECATYFTKLWNQRVNATEPGGDLITMLAQGESTKYMSPMEYLGNVILLIVGGNDTTRNSLTASLLALSENPDQYRKLRENPALVETMIPEIIRWQSPLTHMRRTALQDAELAGKQIKKGDRVVMWYVSGNRDEEAIDEPNPFHHRSCKAASASLLRLRHSSLRRQPAGGNATPHRLGRNPEALARQADRSGRRTKAGLFQLHQGL